MKLGMALLAACLAGSAVWGQTVPEVPDEIAYRILFQLLRSRRGGAWDDRAQSLWLEQRGVPVKFFLPLQSTSDRYWKGIEPFEEDLKGIHSRFAGRNDSPEAAAAARPVREKISEQFRLAVRDLEAAVGAEGAPHLRRLIEEIKKETRRAGAPAGPAGGGGHVH